MATTDVPPSLLTLYKRASQRVSWKDFAYRSLCHRSAYANALKRYRWSSMLSYYHIDLLNFPDQKEEIYAGLVAFTCMKLGLSTEEVVTVFTSVDKKAPHMIGFQVPRLVADEGSSNLVKLVSCGDVGYEISAQAWDNFKEDKNFREVFLNYSFLSTESGLFWSMPKEAYQIASRSNYINSLECFACPFNYNLDAFCSAFSADRLLQYPKGVACYGDFFQYIQKLKEHDDPVRLILNPPYTERIINKVADEVVSYLEVKKNGEFIAMLPDWTPQPGIEKLKALKGSVFHHFASREFYLFDAVHQKSIKPVGMKLLIIVNLGRNKEDSRDMLSDLVDTITKTAARMQ
jgi:hypothetical protein